MRMPVRLLARLIASSMVLSILGTTPGVFSATPVSRPMVLSRDQQVALGIRMADIAPAKAPTLSLPGSVVVPAANQQVVASAVSGLLTEVHVAVGDRVRAGQVLARIQSAQLVEMQHLLTSASTQDALARDTLERDEKLFAEGLIAMSRLRAAQARAAETRSQLAERRLQLSLAGFPAQAGATTALRSQATLTAPVAGIIIEAGAVSGQRIEAASGLFRIASGTELALELQATPEQAAAIRVGDSVIWEQRQLAARVSTIGSAVNAGQTVMIRARLDKGADRARPGESLQAQVRLRLPERAQWRVPAAALAQMHGRAMVFAGREDSLRIVEATVHGRDNDAVMIEAALVAGDRVVISGVPGLKALAGEQRP